MDLVKFQSVVDGGKAAFEGLKKGEAMSDRYSGALKLLRDESVKNGLAVLVAQGYPENTVGQFWPGLRDMKDIDLYDRGWLLTDYALRNFGEPLVREPKAAATEIAGSNGVWALASIIDEILQRPTRKTAGGMVGDWPAGEPAFVRRIEDKIDRLIKHSGA